MTVGGESAGGASVLCHLLSPAAKGLFSQAIVQCAGGLAPFPAFAFGPTMTAEVDMTEPREAAYAKGRRIAAMLGLGETPSADALRAVPAEALLAPEVAAFAPMAAVRGGAVLPADFWSAFATGGLAGVPLMTGNSRDEHTTFALLTYDLNPAAGPIASDAYGDMIERAFGEQAGHVLACYPADAYRSPGQAFASLISPLCP